LRDRNTGEALGFATSASEFVITHTVESEKSGHVAERFILFAQIEKVTDLHGLAGEPKRAGRIGHPNEACGIAEGKRADEKRVDDAENGGACADAEADDENSECGEADVTAQSAEGVAEILQKTVKEWQAAGVTM